MVFADGLCSKRKHLKMWTEKWILSVYGSPKKWKSEKLQIKNSELNQQIVSAAPKF